MHVPRQDQWLRTEAVHACSGSGRPDVTPGGDETIYCGRNVSRSARHRDIARKYPLDTLLNNRIAAATDVTPIRMPRAPRTASPTTAFSPVASEPLYAGENGM